MNPSLSYRTRKLIKPEDLNARGTLFGGQLLKWIDEEAAIFAICKLDNKNVVTKLMSEINFVNTAKVGDIIEIGMGVDVYGKTSITLKCDVRNKNTKESIITIARIVFVLLDEFGKPTPHGKGDSKNRMVVVN
jgi:acyl-CoA thioesterase YciA